MAIVLMPAGLVAAQERFTLVARSKVFQSDASPVIQTVSRPGSLLWTTTISCSNVPLARLRDLEAWHAAMGGLAGRTYAGPQYFDAAQGGWKDDSPQVDGAQQLGTSILVNNLTANQVGWIKKGDYMSWDTAAGRELHVATADADTDGSGFATVQIAPPQRVSVPANTAITLTKPTCIMGLQDDQGLSIIKRQDLHASMDITLIERPGPF